MRAMVFCLLFTSAFASAGDISWSGRYRAEGMQLYNPGLESSKRDRSYILHHFVMEPKIVAADGLNIFGRFDILNNSDYDNNQLGQTLGSGVRTTTTPTAATPRNTSSNVQRDETLRVTQLYATWLQDFSSLTVGRAPLDFGLGMTYNAGHGEFDHWLTTRDMVGLKMVFGNLSLTPIFGKVSEGYRGDEDDVNDFFLRMDYDNPDTLTQLGVMYQVRSSTKLGNDAAVGSYFGDSTSTIGDGWNGKQINIFVKRGFPSFQVGVEASFLNAATGVKRSDGRDVSWEAFGIASDLAYQASGSAWKFAMKAGVATGDDPNTTDKYESYLFNRNYDVANLMFNQVLGNAAYDIFRTGSSGRSLNRSGTEAEQNSVNGAVDEESLSNVTYLVPSVTWQMSEKWSLLTRVAWAQLMADPLSGASKDVGYEWDLNVAYRPHSRFVLGMDLGLLFPGKAFKGNSTTNYESATAFGLLTKAAISF